MTPRYRDYLRTLAVKEAFENDIPSHGTLGTQWVADQIAEAERQNACYLARARPGRRRLWIENASGIACIIAVIALAIYGVMP